MRLEVRFGTQPSGVKAAAHFDTGRDVIAESEWNRYSVGLAALAPGIHSVSMLARLDPGVPLGAETWRCRGRSSAWAMSPQRISLRLTPFHRWPAGPCKRSRSEQSVFQPTMALR